MTTRFATADLFERPLAILPETLAVLVGLPMPTIAGWSRPSFSANRTRVARSAHGRTAIIPVYGVISRRSNILAQVFGWTSLDVLTFSFREALADPDVKAIVFDVDSPGGTVDGVPELADEILRARGQKKIIAVANTMATSAAYWLASAASEVAVSPSGVVGSIGVFVAHEDISKALEQDGVKISLISAGKFKTDGSPYGPLSTTARADLKSKVDAFHSMFVRTVARGRGVSESAVRNGFGEGRTVVAKQAVRTGMVDQVASLDEVLSGRGSSAARMTVDALRRRDLAATRGGISVDLARRYLEILCA